MFSAVVVKLVSSTGLELVEEKWVGMIFMEDALPPFIYEIAFNNHDS